MKVGACSIDLLENQRNRWTRENFPQTIVFSMPNTPNCFKFNPPGQQVAALVGRTCVNICRNILFGLTDVHGM